MKYPGHCALNERCVLNNSCDDISKERPPPLFSPQIDAVRGYISVSSGHTIHHCVGCIQVEAFISSAAPCCHSSWRSERRHHLIENHMIPWVAIWDHPDAMGSLSVCLLWWSLWRGYHSWLGLPTVVVNWKGCQMSTWTGRLWVRQWRRLVATEYPRQIW